MKNKKGFTLIELLAVIAILGLLATITGISVNRILRKSKTEINDIQMKMFEEAAKEYVLDHRSEYKDSIAFSVQISDLENYIDGSIEGYNGCVLVSGCIGGSCDGKTTYEYESDVGKCSLKILSNKIKEDNGSIKETKPDFSKPDTIDKGLIKDADNDGDTYYFRGAVENNYVKFDGLKWNNNDEYHTTSDDMLWRIVRINGDGTIRLIADGSIGTSPFNENFNEEKYVGYTFLDDEGNVQDSTIKKYLEDWYEKNMKDYDKYIATSKFCNDTSTGTDYGSYIEYGVYDRFSYSSSPIPSFECKNTKKNYGGEYDLKVGLITADEVIFAGGFPNYSTESFYLYGKTDYFWTSSPERFDGAANIYFAGYVMDSYEVYNNGEVLPVINLKASVQLTNGSGTKSDPYVVG